MSQSGVFSLLELNQSLKQGIKSLYPEALWATAEISELKENRNGHCYIELIEKDKASGAIVARMRAVIWSFTYRVLKPYFETSTGYVLGSGMCVLVKATLEFNELYGLSLDIRDIDPAYTVGEIELKKQKIVSQLVYEGIFDMNRQLELPEVIQHIAIVSSPTAAGLQDFQNHLKDNPYGYTFYTKVFPAFMQGEHASDSIIEALDAVYLSTTPYDAVVMVRGGGAESELDCFNSYPLCAQICQFPIPVLTGIGHDKDETVADLAAWQSFKTPTAVAGFLIEHQLAFENQLVDFQGELAALVDEAVETFNQEIRQNANALRRGAELWRERVRKLINANHRQLLTVVSDSINRASRNLLIRSEALKSQTSLGMLNAQATIHHLGEQVLMANPSVILARGFALITKDGRRLKQSATISEGDILNVHMSDGIIETKVIANQALE